MNQHQTIQNTLKQLFADFFGYNCEQIEKLPAAGSARSYYRLSSKKESVIGTYHPVIAENEAFNYYSGFFRKHQLAVPEVLAVSRDKQFYLQTDVGNQSLFQLLQTEKLSPQVQQYFKDSLYQLIHFQSIGINVDFSKSFPYAQFDRNSILFDLDYFKNYFVRIHPLLQFDENKLKHDFQKFTTILLEADFSFFMYRDFQSRNIMIHEGKPWFIDFQGGRKGPLAYDVVSLLYQSKAQLTESWRETLKLFYLDQLDQFLPGQRQAVEQHFYYFVYLRLFQVLGAYGLRGLIPKKSHFITSIPYILQTIKQLQNSCTILQDFPELKQVVDQISLLEHIYPLPVFESQQLSVQVSSFSYLMSGIPTDLTGHGGGFVFDCRALPNPGREPAFQSITGNDIAVIDYLKDKAEVIEFQQHIKSILRLSIKEYLNRRFQSLSIQFGCTGGQHRSVFMANAIAKWIQSEFPVVHVIKKHLEIQ